MLEQSKQRTIGYIIEDLNKKHVYTKIENERENTIKVSLIFAKSNSFDVRMIPQNMDNTTKTESVVINDRKSYFKLKENGPDCVKGKGIKRFCANRPVH